MGEALTG
jgi:hypothetical protein